MARRRQRWKKHQGWIDPARLIFIDETWTKTNMAPLRGWCRRGERLRAKVPHGHWKTMTFLAALRCDRIEAPWLLDGPINSESFRVYIEHVLLPTLKRGDVVIIDNLGSHKGQAIRTLIRSADAKLLFLLPYSIHRALGNVVARRSFYEGTVDDDLSGVRSSRCSAP